MSLCFLRLQAVGKENKSPNSSESDGSKEKGLGRGSPGEWSVSVLLSFSREGVE